MVNDAEKYKAEDEAVAARIASKNGLESYSYNLRNSIEGDLKDKLEADDKAKLEKEINETISWLDASQEASKEEYDERQKALEAIANPIMVSISTAYHGQESRAETSFYFPITDEGLRRCWWRYARRRYARSTRWIPWCWCRRSRSWCRRAFGGGSRLDATLMMY
jgi:hypothetical protein